LYVRKVGHGLWGGKNNHKSCFFSIEYKGNQVHSQSAVIKENMNKGSLWVVRIKNSQDIPPVCLHAGQLKTQMLYELDVWGIETGEEECGKLRGGPGKEE